MKGTYVERDRKKEKKKTKGPDAAGSKKGVPGAAAAMVAGVPAAMPVSRLNVGKRILLHKLLLVNENVAEYHAPYTSYSLVSLLRTIKDEFLPLLRNFLVETVITATEFIITVYF